MGVDMSGIGAVQARIAEIQAKFSNFGSPVQPGTYSADGALNGRTAWNYKLQDLIGRDYNNTKFPWSGVDVSPYNTTGGGSGISGTFTSGNSRISGTTAAARAPLAGGLAAGVGVSGAAVVDSAKKYLGVPYVWGGTSAQGLDCSGLVQKAYGDLGISLPRVAADQAKMGTAIPSLAQARPGDLLAFGSPVDHIAIYVGNNQMIAAPEPGDKVKIQSVYATPVSIRRIVPDGPDLSSASRIGSAAFTAGLTGGSGPVGSALAQAPAQFRALFQQAEARYGVPATLLAAVAKQESGFNAGAVSPAGAIGLMQIMPGTAAGLKVNPRDPAQAVDGAARLLRDNLRTFGSTQLALAAYNAGPGAVQRYGGIPPYAETQNYIRRIMADRGVSA